MREKVIEQALLTEEELSQFRCDIPRFELAKIETKINITEVLRVQLEKLLNLRYKSGSPMIAILDEEGNRI